MESSPGHLVVPRAGAPGGERPHYGNLVVILAMVLSLGCGCHRGADYPNRPITLVCPWGIGGGTDQISRQVAIHLEQELGQPVNVINRTGGQGTIGHIRGLKSDADGYTIAMITVELNMFHWNRLADLTYRDALPLASLNEDAAALFVHHEAPWHTLPQFVDHLRNSPDKVRVSGTSNGGIWHLAMVGWLQMAGFTPDAITWVASQGAAPALSDMLPGSAVCCSLPEARILLKEGRVRCLGVMAEERLGAPFDDVPTFREQGYDWALYGWRGLALPVGTPPQVVERLKAALDRVVAGETQVSGKTFLDFIRDAGFNLTVRRGDEFGQFLATQDEQLGQLISAGDFAEVAQGTIGPMLFPYLLLGMLGISLLAMLWRTFGSEQTELQPRPDDDVGPSLFFFLLVPLAVSAYIGLAPIAGFVLTAFAMLAGMFILLGTRIWVSLIVAAVLSPTLYQLFAHGLRVSLPRGWLAW